MLASVGLPDAALWEMTETEWRVAIAEMHRAEREELSALGGFRVRVPQLTEAAHARWVARGQRLHERLACELLSVFKPDLDKRAADLLAEYVGDLASRGGGLTVRHLADIALLPLCNLAAGRDMLDPEPLVVPRLMSAGASRSTAYALRGDTRRLWQWQDRQRRREWRQWMVDHGWSHRAADRWIERHDHLGKHPELFAPWRNGGPFTAALPTVPAFRANAHTTVSFALADGRERRLAAVQHNQILWTITPETTEDRRALERMGFPPFLPGRSAPQAKRLGVRRATADNPPGNRPVGDPSPR